MMDFVAKKVFIWNEKQEKSTSSIVRKMIEVIHNVHRNRMKELKLDSIYHRIVHRVVYQFHMKIGMMDRMMQVQVSMKMLRIRMKRELRNHRVMQGHYNWLVWVRMSLMLVQGTCSFVRKGRKRV